jgi:glycosyltransferase involved in cell wall biosynthesis
MSKATASVIVPVKDGARYLEEVIAAVRAQRSEHEVELLVIDSGSRDGSADIARRGGAHVVEIAPEEFGHGRTRNLAAEQASGDYLLFLTQDATPATDRWLELLAGALDRDARIGLSFGPHLPRPGTSAMVARELEEFFTSFSPNGNVRVDSSPDSTEPATGFFSNVNSCVLRECWEQARFRDVGYAEDQAFARDAMAAGWKKAYVPDAAVLHSHDYPFAEFMRRYFDEYRGLRETIGHVEPLGARRLAGAVRAGVRGDLAYLRRKRAARSERALWAARSARHHGGRALFSALGSRAGRLPAPVRARLSLEGRDGTPDGDSRPAQLITERVKPPYDFVRTSLRAPLAPLAPPSPADAEAPLHLAWVIPPFRRGSGGHMTIFAVVAELEARGHSCSIWIHDPMGQMDRRVALAHREVIEHFTPVRAGVFRGFDDWHGADVALATGWQTAYPLRTLPACRLKAYYVQDYEPDFYPASAERIWAEQTYELGFPCLASSPWLRDLLRDRYGARAEAFEYGVDLDTYHPLDVERERETILFYARPATPRRATELGVLALAELVERRPNVRVVAYGDVKKPYAPFDYAFLGVVPPARLARLYNQATVGLVISLTNYSLVPKEMMACGLPVVDVRGASIESVFGSEPEAIALADRDPLSLAAELASLLEDPQRRQRSTAAAHAFVQEMTWEATAATIEHQLRGWLAERWSDPLESLRHPEERHRKQLDQPRHGGAHLT